MSIYLFMVFFIIFISYVKIEIKLFDAITFKIFKNFKF